MTHTAYMKEYGSYISYIYFFSLFYLATARSNGCLLWTLPVCQRELWDRLLCTIKNEDRPTDQQTDRQTDSRNWITRSTSTHQGMNHLTVSVTLAFLSQLSVDVSFTLSAGEWPFRPYLLWNAQCLYKNRISILFYSF